MIMNFLCFSLRQHKIERAFLFNFAESRVNYRFVKRCSSSSTSQNGTSGVDKTVSEPKSFLKSEADWKRNQFDKITEKFGETRNKEKEPTPIRKIQHPSVTIENDEDLQPMWKDMESRVTKRRLPPRMSSNTKKIGRSNVRKSDEDAWLDAGLYGNSVKGE